MIDRTPSPLPAPGRGVVINGPSPHDWIETYETVALVALAALPLAAMITWWLARRRSRAGSTTASAWSKSLAEVGILHGTLPWLWLTLLPASSDRAVHGTVSLVPLRDLTAMPTYQILGNLLIFAALGFFAPARFRQLASIPRILAVAALCSVLIETAQYTLRLDRVSSVDDVLLNAIGAGLAAHASRRWWRTQPSRPNARPEKLDGSRRISSLVPPRSSTRDRAPASRPG